ncbi:MAG: polysaccharide deacetylase, partial [Lachnospiraceae bacterium]|nr:polysaccharide deacetylase [Lachnospiraceae bacterium]
FGSCPYRWQGMTFYPISFLLSRSLKKKTGVTTMVVHTNEIDDAGMERMRRLLSEQQDNLISYSDFLAMASRKKGACGHLWEHMLATAKRVLVKLKQERHG